METYKIITLENDADGKSVQVEREATPEEILEIKEKQRLYLESVKERIGEEAFAILFS